MGKTFAWIFGILFGLLVLGVVFSMRSDREAYRVARGAIEERVEVRQDRIDMVVEMATKAVDTALVLAGDLPSQQAQADLVKQDIEEIGNRLKEAAELRGDESLAKLEATVDLFNQTLKTVDDAAKNAENPVVKSVFDRIYGVLLAAQEQIKQIVLETQN